MGYGSRGQGVEIAKRIGELRRSVQGLLDGDVVLPADGRLLLAGLDGALPALTAGDAVTVRAGMEQFLDRVTALMAAGILEAGDADPRIDAARAILEQL